MEEKRYEIGDKIYIQRTLVLGQWKQLGGIMQGIAIPGDLNPISFVAALGDNLFSFMAVILTEEGRTPQGKDIPGLATEIEYGITPDTAIEVIAHFFELNPIPSLLNRLWTLTEQIREKLMEIGLTNSASLSVPVTSPDETGSSGMSPSGRQGDGQSAP